MILTGDELTTGGRRKLSDVVAEYETRRAAIPAVCAAFNDAGEQTRGALCVGGTYFYDQLDTGGVTERHAESLLLKSAWRHVYEHPDYNLKYLASAEDKSRIERMLEQPPAFTLENLFEWFGDLAADPRAAILRGLAEVFMSLDPAFKSHEKMKIGVKGLPKRVILTNVSSWGWGFDRLHDILNALAAVQVKPLVSHQTTRQLIDDGEALRESHGVWLKRYANGNGHLHFSPETLRVVNVALAEYYGDVLPDCPDERPTQSASTDVAKDLQYYPTPPAVIRELLGDAYRMDGKNVLEPSCGCGRILDALREHGADVFGIEYDPSRAAESRAKGHAVQRANFLEVLPSPDFDFVVMNPPFYGRHYEKHVRHALRFLKPGGTLYAVLPVTARYDHGALDDLRPRWSDLPVGAFRESGTNINTTIARIRA